MKSRTIDLDALEWAVGPCPRRYPKGNPHNFARKVWFDNAAAALRSLAQRTDARAAKLTGRRRKQPCMDSIVTEAEARKQPGLSTMAWTDERGIVR